MFKSEVIRLYETLDFVRDPKIAPDQPIQLFRRTEGAVITHELLWILGDPASYGQAYRTFSQQTQRLVNFPGQKRMRVVASSEEDLSSFRSDHGGKYTLSQDVSRHSWTSLLNSLFRSDQFCQKVFKEYESYRASLSIQISGLTDLASATWSIQSSDTNRIKRPEFVFRYFS